MKGMRIIYDGSEGVKTKMEEELRAVLDKHGYPFNGSGMTIDENPERDMTFDGPTPDLIKQK